MDTPLKPRLHPILWAAALAVIAAALGVIGSTTGWLQASPADTPAVGPPVALAEVDKPAVAASAASAPATERKTSVVVPKPRPRPQPAPSAAHIPLASATLPDGDRPPPPRDYPAPPRCDECGTVETIRAIAREGDGSGLGAVAGGVVGGALGNNIGDGNGRTLATLAGVIGGALLGNKIEKDQKKTALYEISIRMEDGTRSVVTSETRPAWQMGDAVRVRNGSIVSR
ncbi:MAG: glycine zipper 2TM domain-containing protein [Rhodocyclaceae bacterium]|jgi:outer membrane lipoprotein SlyB|nr:glycine zipper 2TM domain-containing protein [Rhodocyclaceae bacterium]